MVHRYFWPARLLNDVLRRMLRRLSLRSHPAENHATTCNTVCFFLRN